MDSMSKCTPGPSNGGITNVTKDSIHIEGAAVLREEAVEPTECDLSFIDKPWETTNRHLDNTVL